MRIEPDPPPDRHQRASVWLSLVCLVVPFASPVLQIRLLGPVLQHLPFAQRNSLDFVLLVGVLVQCVVGFVIAWTLVGRSRSRRIRYAAAFFAFASAVAGMIWFFIFAVVWH